MLAVPKVSIPKINSSWRACGLRQWRGGPALVLRTFTQPPSGQQDHHGDDDSPDTGEQARRGTFVGGAGNELIARQARAEPEERDHVAIAEETGALVIVLGQLDTERTVRHEEGRTRRFVQEQRHGHPDYQLAAAEGARR